MNNKSWQQSLILRGQRDPVWWISEVLGDRLWSKQEDICYSIVENERTACPACFSDDTEILTETRGFQLFKDLLPTDKVGSYCNGHLVFVYPQAFHVYDYDGDLIGYDSEQLNFLITPNHRCLIKNGEQFVEALANSIYGTSAVFCNGAMTIDAPDHGWYKKHYSGKVYCVSVPSGFIYVRRNGLVHVSGNSYGVGKCMAYGEQMVLANGNVVLIESLIGKSFEVLAWDSVTNTVHVSNAFAEDNGLKPVYEVMTDAGLSIIRTGNHPLWVSSSKLDKTGQLADWVSVENLRSGMWVAAKTPVGESFIQNEHLPPGYSWQRVEYLRYKSSQPTVGVCVPGYSTYLTTFVEHNTFLAARIALWFLYCFRPAKVISTAPTSRQVRDLLWAELRTAHKKAKVPLGGKPLQLSLTLSTDHFAVGFSTDEDNTDKFTGYHSPNQMVIFDQAAGIPTALWESAEGLMTSANCKWLVISNTAISDSEMANICIPGRKTRFGKWNIIKIRASESPNVVEGRDIYPGLVSFDWVKRRTEAWGKDDPLYKIFIDAEFVESSQMTVVPYQFVQPAFENAGEVDGTIEIGVDVARSGLDSTVFFARSGTKALRIHRLTGHDTMEVVGALVEFVREVEEFYGMPVTAIKIDVIGIGAGVYDRCVELEEIDLPVIAVNNAEKAVVDPDRYLNLRAEQCWNFRRLMETGAVGLADVVVNDLDIMEYLKQDINIMRYKISQSSGKIQIWSKEDLKLILGRSPDYFDSCVLAYCTPGGLVSVEAINTLPTIARQEAGFTVNLTQEEWEVLLGIRVPLDHKSFR